LLFSDIYYGDSEKVAKACAVGNWEKVPGAETHHSAGRGNIASLSGDPSKASWDQPFLLYDFARPAFVGTLIWDGHCGTLRESVWDVQENMVIWTGMYIVMDIPLERMKYLARQIDYD
jgi:hypothetical protein